MKKILQNKYVYIPFTIILFLFVANFVSGIFFDNDGYWIIATGKYISENGIPKTNPFTIVHDLNIIIQQWPWTIYCYQIYHTFGRAGLYISSLILFILNILVFLKIAKLKNADTKITTFFILGVFCIDYIFISIRPTLVTTLLLALEILILEYYKRTNKKAILSLLILISFFEINFHSAIWFLHFVFMLPYLVSPIKNPFVLFKKDDIKRIPLLITMIPMFLVGILNPYGMNGMLYIVYSFGDKLKNAGISELGCWTLKSFYGLLIIFSVIVIFYLLIKRKEKETTIDAATFYLFCGTTIMGCMYIRNLIYFIFGLIMIFIELISVVDFSKFYQWIEKQVKFTTLYVWCIVFAFLILFGNGIIENVKTETEDSAMTPVKAIEYLDKNKINKDNTRIYTEFNNGGYFEFNDYHCFIDARPELYFEQLNKKSDVFDDYTKVNNAKNVKNISKFLEKYQFEYLCITKGTIFDTYMQMNKNYKIVVNEKEYHVYQNLQKE